MIEHDDRRPIRYIHAENERGLLPGITWQMRRPYGSREDGPILGPTSQKLATCTLSLAVSLGSVLVDPPLHLVGGYVSQGGVGVPGLHLNDGTSAVRREDRIAWLPAACATVNELGPIHEARQTETGRDIAGAVLHGFAMRPNPRAASTAPSCPARRSM